MKFPPLFQRATFAFTVVTPAFCFQLQAAEVRQLTEA